MHLESRSSISSRTPPVWHGGEWNVPLRAVLSLCIALDEDSDPLALVSVVATHSVDGSPPCEDLEAFMRLDDCDNRDLYVVADHSRSADVSTSVHTARLTSTSEHVSHVLDTSDNVDLCQHLDSSFPDDAPSDSAMEYDRETVCVG